MVDSNFSFDEMECIIKSIKHYEKVVAKDPKEIIMLRHIIDTLEDDEENS